MNIPHRRAIALALVVTVLWSSSWVIIRFGLDDEGLRPLTFAGVRYLIAGLVLLGACVIGPRTRQSLTAVRGRLAERPSPIQVVGIVLVTAGIVWSQLGRQKQQPAVADGPVGK